MATLTPIEPDADGTVTGITTQTGATTGLYVVVTDGLDSTYLHPGVDAGGDVFLRLSDVDADLDTMDTLVGNFRVRMDGTVIDDTMTLTAQVFDGNSTATALTNSVAVATEVNAGSTFNAKVPSFTIQGTPTKAQWNNAYLRMVWTYTKTKGSDGISLQVSELEITGTYTAAPARTGTVAQTLPSLSQSAAGTSNAPATTNLPVTSGLVLDLDADAITGLADGDPVATWDDQSGNGNDATQATAANRPLYRTGVLNGLPVVRFDGSTDYLRQSVFLTDTAGVTIVALFRTADASQSRQPIFYNGDGAGDGYGLIHGRESVADTDLRALYGGVAWHEPGVSLVTDEWYTATLTIQGDSTPLIHLDGTQIYSAPTALSPVTPSGDAAVGHDSQDVATPSRLNGDIAQIAVYDRALTTQERQDVEDYLTTKWLATGPTFTGTAAQTLPSFSQSASGTFVAEVVFTGTAAQTLPALTQSATGTVVEPTFTGDAAQTLPSLAQSAAGTHVAPTYTATASQTIAALTQSASGTAVEPTFTATTAQTLPSLTQTAAGTVAVPVYTGTADSTLPALTQDAAGTHVPPAFTATAAQTLPALSQSATGTHVPPVYTATTSQTLPSLTQAATGTNVPPTYTATASQTLPAVVQSASGSPVQPTFTGTAAQSLPAVAQSASGTVSDPVDTATASQTLPAVTQTASGTHTPPAYTGTVSTILPAVSQSATGTVSDPVDTGTVTQTLPSFTQSAAGTFVAPTYTGTAAQALPALGQSATGTASAPGAFTATASQTLPAFTQTAAGTTDVPVYTGTAAQTLPAFSQQAAGIVLAPTYTGNIDQALAAFTQAAAGTHVPPGYDGTAAQTLPALIQQASGQFFEGAPGAPVVFPTTTLLLDSPASTTAVDDGTATTQALDGPATTRTA